MFKAHIFRRGLSLIEVLIVTAIIGVLIGLLLPAAQKARDFANRTRCQSNLRSLGTALGAYHDVNRCYPRARFHGGSADSGTKLTSEATLTYNHSGFTSLLPYVEQSNLYSRYNFDYPSCDVGGGMVTLAGGGIENCPDNANAEVVGTYVSTYSCPADDAPPKIDSIGTITVSGTVTVFNQIIPVTATSNSARCTNARRSSYLFSQGVFNGSGTRIKDKDIIDGLSNTIAIGEARQNPAWHEKLLLHLSISPLYPHWGTCHVLGGPGEGLNFPAGKIPGVQARNIFTPNDPAYWQPLPSTFSSMHGTGAHLLFCDGSVHYLRNDTSKPLLLALCTMNGKEPASCPD